MGDRDAMEFEEKDYMILFIVSKHKLLIRIILFFMVFDMIIGAIYAAGQVDVFWYLWRYASFIHWCTNLICIMLTYKVVESVYHKLFDSYLCTVCKHCCLWSKRERNLKSIEYIQDRELTAVTLSDAVNVSMDNEDENHQMMQTAQP